MMMKAAVLCRFGFYGSRGASIMHRLLQLTIALPTFPKTSYDPSMPEKEAKDERPQKDSAAAGANNPPDLKALTPEEQMALYEKDLKENDWGHQPC